MRCIRRVHRARLIVSVSYLFLRYEDTIPISLRYFATVRRAILLPGCEGALLPRCPWRGVLRKHLPDAPPDIIPAHTFLPREYCAKEALQGKYARIRHQIFSRYGPADRRGMHTRLPRYPTF